MKDRTTTTHPSVTSHARSHGVVCPMLAVLALALLCSTPSTAQCVVGTNAALSFDGSSDIAYVPNSPYLNGLGDFTIESLIKTTQSSGGNPYIVSKFRGLTPSVTDDVFTVRLSPGGLPFIQLCSGASYFTMYGTTGVNSGVWTHLAVTRSGSAVSVFVNGQPAGSSTFTGALNTTTTPLTIGNGLLFATESPDASGWFQGHLDEVKIWNDARTQTQIQTTMSRGLTLSEAADTNLVAYWRFDEGSGQYALNSAATTGSVLDSTLGANALPGTDDPTWISTGLPPLCYSPPCPTPPCGQVNSPCATLTVNGIGAAAQGPFNVVVPLGGTLSLNWFGPPNQPYVLVATSNLDPGQNVAAPYFVVDVNVGNFAVLFSGFDPYWGPLFFTNAAGTNVQSFGVPTALAGSTLNLQGLIYDLANTCSGGVGLATTASFSIQL